MTVIKSIFVIVMSVAVLAQAGWAAGTEPNVAASDAAAGGSTGSVIGPRAAATGSGVSPVLDARVVNRLYPGTLPSMKHLDDYYRAGNGNLMCRADWRRARSQVVRVQPVSLNFGALKANAAKVGLGEVKLRRVLATFLANQATIPNQNFISVIDFDIASNKRRMFMIDLRRGTVSSHSVAHGSGSGPSGGLATRFSNTSGTHASSLGCSLSTFATDIHGRDLTDGQGRNKLLIQGLESSNDNQCARATFMHAAWYVSAGGRSHGCPAISPTDKKFVFGALSGGALICAYRDGKKQSVTKRTKALH